MLQKLKITQELSRESLNIQSIGSYVETGNIVGALNEALKYADTRYICNIKYSVKKLKRPDRHGFQVVHMLKQTYDI